MTTIKQENKKAIKQLLNNKITSARLDAEVLLSFVLNKPKEFLYTYPDHKLTKSQQTKFTNLIKKRTNGVPVAYLTGQKEFYGRSFIVNKDVLIPRPETELIIDTIKQVNKKTKKQIIIADIGTGSGCIAITLAKELPNTKIIATDISTKALKVAKKNASKHKVLSKISFHQGNLLEPIKDKKIDILIANLPYLDPKWQTNSIKHEPSLALYAKEKGLKLYRELLEQISQQKHQPKIILFEIDPRQKDSIKKVIKKILPLAEISFTKDLAKKDRVAKITL
jgi:release factor glutamine methyltransferase